MGVSKASYNDILKEAKEHRCVSHDSDLTLEDLQSICHEFKSITSYPQDPYDQLQATVESVFLTWNSNGSVQLRRASHLPPDLGTAVVVQSMVYGNLNSNSGSGIAYSRNPINGTIISLTLQNYEAYTVL